MRQDSLETDSGEVTLLGFSYRTVTGATTLILYSDGNSTFGMTRPAFGAYVKELQQQSQLMGDSSAQICIGCIA